MKKIVYIVISLLAFYIHPNVLKGQLCSGPMSLNLLGSTSALPLTVSANVQDVTCSSGNDGGVAVTPSGGSAGYAYSWFDTGVGGAVRTNLVAGTYTVQVTDNVGCIKTETYTVGSPNAITITPTTTSSTICIGSSTTLNVSGSGGTGALSFVWDNGAGAGTSVNVSPTTTTTYTVTAMDVSGCTQTGTVTINVSPTPNAGTGGIIGGCIVSATPLNLMSAISGGMSGGTWTLNSPTTANGFDAMAGTFVPSGNSQGNYVFDYTVSTPSCPSATTQVTVNVDNTTCPIISSLGDHMSGTCPVFSGNTWTDIYDASGNLVFSINPNGNNLGPTCWAVRIVNQPMPRDTTVNYGGPSTMAYFVDRNLVITPTNQPDPSIPVSIRFYALDTEVNRFINAMNTILPSNISANDIYVTRFSGSPLAVVDLDPLNNQITNNTQAAALMQVPMPFGSNWYFAFDTDHFSEFNPGYTPSGIPAVFPVTLLSFDGWEVNNMHELEWVTANEANTSHFDVEHSMDSFLFGKIGEKEAAGNSLTTQTYNFTNEQPQLGNNYYRLKIVDIDGSFNYSNIVHLFYTPTTYFAVYPNPFKEKIIVEAGGIVRGTTTFELYDAAGRLIQSEQWNQTGNFKHEINVGELAKGTYIYKILNGKDESKGKLVKAE